MTLRRLLMCGAFAAAATVGLAQAADVGGRPLYATLTGEAEIPDADLDGGGTARVTINPGKDQVCWELTWNDIAARGASIEVLARAGRWRLQQLINQASVIYFSLVICALR